MGMLWKCYADFAAQSAADAAAKAAVVSTTPVATTTTVKKSTKTSTTEPLPNRNSDLTVKKLEDAELSPSFTPSHSNADSATDASPAANSTDVTSVAVPDAEESLPELPLDTLPAVSLTSDDDLALDGDAVATSKVSAPPIPQQTQRHPRMLTPGNFLYLGGFRPEFGEGMNSRFGYGGLAVAFRPDGDANGPDDGFPGSLYMVGHGHHQLVAEVAIPRPFVSPSKNIDELSVGKILQPFADVTAGLRERMTNGSSEPFEIGGLHVLKNRLHWTMYKYYNVNAVDYLSHGLSSVNLSHRAMRGLWHLGPSQSGDPRWHSYKHAGYICDIPKPIAARYFGGRNLMSGLQISTGRQTSSQGPALFAYRIDNEDLPYGSSLSAIPLLWYPMNDPVDQHHPADSWQGAAWLTLGKKHTVIVVGRKGLGPVHYGLPRPGDCYEDKGYHASSYETQVLFYRPEDLVAATRRSVASVAPWYRWDSRTPGGGIDRFMYQECRKRIGGTALDRKRNLLYVVEVNAGFSSVNEYEPLPVVHVFRIVE